MDTSEFQRRYVRDGRFSAVPRNPELRRQMLAYLADGFDSGVDYTEREVNERLKAHHDDVTYLRRLLVEAGFLERERDGSVYRLCEEPA